MYNPIAEAGLKRNGSKGLEEVGGILGEGLMSLCTLLLHGQSMVTAMPRGHCSLTGEPVKQGSENLTGPNAHS